MSKLINTARSTIDETDTKVSVNELEFAEVARQSNWPIRYVVKPCRNYVLRRLKYWVSDDERILETTAIEKMQYPL